mgnify:CR=1 FL=1
MKQVRRTVIVRSSRLPKSIFKMLIELEDAYRSMVEQLVLYTVRNKIKSFIKLKALKYHEMRSLYPQLPSHHVYTACQDASTRVKSFLRLKRKGLAKKEYLVVRKVSIWLDDHLWKPNGLTWIRIATHKGWIAVDFEPHKQYWRYVNSGWRLASEARVKLDKKNRRLIIYFTFVRDVEEYEPRGFIPVDVNEDNVAVLVDGKAYLFETGQRKLVLGYHYRRKKIQEKYDKIYGVKSRMKRKIMRKLKERRKKLDIKHKIANIIVGVAHEKQYAIVLEKLGKHVANGMLRRIRDRQLRHRIYQASFRGIQRAIEEKAKEYGVPVAYVDPRNTSKLCPIHGCKIKYNSRTGKCVEGGEIWHRDVAACWNILLRALSGDGGYASSPIGLDVDGRAVPLPSTATHDPIALPKGLWTRRKSLPQKQNATISNKMKR